MITNSDQFKHTCHSKGCPNSHINTQCTPSGGNAGVYSLIQTVIKVSNVILRYIVPRILDTLSQFGNGFGKLWRKSRPKFSLHHVPYVLNWREVWGSYWPGKLYTTKSTLRQSTLQMYTGSGFLLRSWVPIVKLLWAYFIPSISSLSLFSTFWITL